MHTAVRSAKRLNDHENLTDPHKALSSFTVITSVNAKFVGKKIVDFY